MTVCTETHSEKVYSEMAQIHRNSSVVFKKKTKKKPLCAKATTVSVADVGIVECGRCVAAKGNRIMKYL